MKPKIVLTCGDINGIGPELALRILNNKNLQSRFDIKVIGPKFIFDYNSNLLKIRKIPEKSILDLPLYKDIEIKTGRVDALAGRISGDAIKLGVELCRKRFFDAMVTLPINKESLNLGGYHYSGHTDMLAHLTMSKNTFMLMYSDILKIVPLTIHIPLKKVPASISKKKFTENIIDVNNSFVKTFKVKKPAIAVLGLNPHSGDGGLIGNEEEKILSPVISYLKKIGFNIKGPYSADGFFGSKMYKKFDVVIAMYHDQAMIPFKILSKDSGVNFTGGLRIIRTSPAHGTAYDIAGKGIAKETSTIEAVKLAGKLTEIY
jgi:4-hydroxythreonine-4-phosphate dehydrogenase